jgi:hypothetical protein
MCVTKDEAALIAEVVKDSSVHINIGTIWGDTSILASLAGATNVYTVEPMEGGFFETYDPVANKQPTPQTLANNIAKFGLDKKIVYVRARSDPWPLIGVEPDTILIDGDHRFNPCLTDWNNASARATRAIIIHDVDKGHPDVQKVINEHVLKNPIWRKTKVVDSTVVFERHSSPLVSVIVPTYNRPELLIRALESIAEQSFQDYEIIVVNDAGRGIYSLIKDFPRIRHKKHRKNSGLAAARNTGAKEAKGIYVAYLDDDDWYYKHHLETLVQAMNRDGARFVYSDAHGIDRYKVREVYCSRDYNKEHLRKKNLTPVCCVMHHRGLFEEAGYFDETLKNHEDWDLWIRMSEVTDFVHIKEVTCAIDRTRSTMNTDKDAMRAGLELVKARHGS